MTSASSLAFPGSRTLATWWRQLAPLEPKSLRVGYLFLHRLEAPALWLKQQPLDPLLGLVLEALTLVRKVPTSSSLGDLAKPLHLDSAVLRALLQSLCQLQLVENSATNAEPAWLITESGQEALRTKKVWARQWQRGQFPFLERLGPTGGRLGAPHYLKILDAPSSIWNVEDTTAFDVGWLDDCLVQPLEWKKTFGFPLDLIGFSKSGKDKAPWENIILDRAERLLVLFFQGPKPEEELFGFGVRPEGWVLNAAEPILRLPAAAQALLSEPDQPEPMALWRNAWQSWCQNRTVPLKDIQECLLSLSGECLRIEAPDLLIQYLQVGKSDIFKGETWLLAGDGYLRQAARLELMARR